MIRLLAGLLLLVQLQPLAGAFMCLPAPHAEEEECMPPDQQASAPDASTTLSSPAESCPTIGLCAPAGMAVIAMGQVISHTSGTDGKGAVAVASSLPSAPHAPPFHPPRA